MLWQLCEYFLVHARFVFRSIALIKKFRRSPSKWPSEMVVTTEAAT